MVPESVVVGSMGLSRFECNLNVKNYQDFDTWCRRHSMQVTYGRHIVAKVVHDLRDCPQMDELRRRVCASKLSISLPTLYRTLRHLLEFGIVERHRFRDGPARYEPALDEHQAHLINVTSGRVIAFRSDEIERLQGEVVSLLGYQLIGHMLDLCGVPLRRRKHRSASPQPFSRYGRPASMVRVIWWPEDKRRGSAP